VEPLEPPTSDAGGDFLALETRCSPTDLLPTSAYLPHAAACLAIHHIGKNSIPQKRLGYRISDCGVSFPVVCAAGRD
jgi:hypothetical protein